MSVRQVIGFRVDRELYGVPIDQVHEIVRLPAITPVPDALAGIEGIMNLRGRIVAVLDLRRRLRLPPAPRSARTRVLVVEVAGQRLGLLVDEASEVIKVPDAAVEPPPAEAFGVGEENLVTGVGKLDGRLVLLVDLERLVSKEALTRLAALEAGATGGAEPTSTRDASEEGEVAP
jgi:purine-binding chemotaxis protein CheW